MFQDVVHCFSAKNYEPAKNVEMTWADSNLGVTFKVVSVAAGADLSKKLLCLALRHYDLASTTVTGTESNFSTAISDFSSHLFTKLGIIFFKYFRNNKCICQQVFP